MAVSHPTHMTLCGTHFHGPTHICAFVDSRDQQYEILLPFLQQGVEDGECLLTISDPTTANDHMERLQNFGLDAAELAEQGHMLDVTADQCYTKGGRFSGKDMYEILSGAVDRAVAKGYSKVRGFGEMQWARHGLPGTEELIAYESRVNYLSPKLTAVCVYDVNGLDGRTILDVLNTHPKVIMGGRIHDNHYYIHPDVFLKSRLGQMTTAEQA